MQQNNNRFLNNPNRRVKRSVSESKKNILLLVKNGIVLIVKIY